MSYNSPKNAKFEIFFVEEKLGAFLIKYPFKVGMVNKKKVTRERQLTIFFFEIRKNMKEFMAGK